MRTPASSVPADAEAAVTIGRSTKAEVLAALGRTATIAFDSGYEIWVYRIAGAPQRPAAAEFVLLFAPSGVLARTRVRPAPSPAPANGPDSRVRNRTQG